MKLLIIEDEAEMRDILFRYFRKMDHECFLAEGYTTGRQLLLYAHYDCVLLDLALPDGHGLDLLIELRDQQRQEGVIVVSANAAPEQKIRALDNGADDYLTKPFHLPELNARLLSVVRRRQFNASKYLRFNELTVRVDDRQCFINENPVNLSPKESALLLLLVTNHRRVVSKVAIADRLTGSHAGYFDTYDIVYAHMKNLKKKLAEAGCPDYIVTVHGIGYKFESFPTHHQTLLK
jgi:DNA-binding response OmpR family regulator